MKKPKQYEVVYQTTRNVPYTTAPLYSESKDNCGGVLGKGTRVWLAQEGPHAAITTAYADHIGIVSLNSKLLELMRPALNEKAARPAPVPAA